MSVLLQTIIQALTDVSVIPSQLPADIGVEDLCASSAKAGEKSLFICIRGFVSDGHAYAPDAYTRGCRCFLAERQLDLPADAVQLIVPNTRIAEAEAAAVFYGHPDRELRLVGLTGTKGKTTTALFIQKILCDNGIPTGYIGTNGIVFGDKTSPAANSTPDSLILYAALREMADAGMKAAVLEVSSQGLKLHRTHGLTFHACVFTNLSPDHIGGNEHPDYKDYAACKRLLFSAYSHRYTVSNTDDPAAAYMTEKDPATVISVSRNSREARWSAPVVQGLVRNGIPGMEYACTRGEESLPHMSFLPQPGEFNVKNALCALAVACDTFDVPLASACRSLETAVVAGRFETVFCDHVLYVIDYAHNAVSLSSMLDLLRGYHPTRLICLFGSVGERTKERRRELAEAAGCRADLCILTSDNPGREDPMDILREINGSFPEGSCDRVLIPDRAAAVAYAVSIAEPGDTILLAGKGHETYQLVGREKLPYREKDVLLGALEKSKI